ncbi:hypothetical protein D3C86_1893010 [compost metagenome]
MDVAAHAHVRLFVMCPHGIVIVVAFKVDLHESVYIVNLALYGRSPELFALRSAQIFDEPREISVLKNVVIFVVGRRLGKST